MIIPATILPAFGIVFVCNWPTEVAQHSVTHELCNVAPELFYSLGNSRLIGLYNIPQIFRIKQA